VAWRIVFKATCFIFPHWETELEEYNDYITSYFTLMHPSTHLKVLNLDRAICKHIGSVNNVLLNEFNKYHYLETHHLQGHGAGKSGASSEEKIKQRDISDLMWRKSNPCHLWNDGKCTHQASTCKFRHICELCQGPHAVPELIKGASRWSSIAFEHYIQKNPVVLHTLILSHSSHYASNSIEIEIVITVEWSLKIYAVDCVIMHY
jgi:hypothetical protein